MTPLRALARRLWPLLDWRRHAVLEARGRRGAAAMLDESMRRTVATLRWEREGEERFIPLRPRATDPPSIPLRPLVEGPPGVWVEPEGLPVLDLSSALPLARTRRRRGGPAADDPHRRPADAAAAGARGVAGWRRLPAAVGRRGAVIGELRAQERQPCPWPNTHCGVMPEYATRMGRCVGCAGDGTRWVVAGTLREDQPEGVHPIKHPGRPERW